MKIMQTSVLCLLGAALICSVSCVFQSTQLALHNHTLHSQIDVGAKLRCNKTILHRCAQQYFRHYGFRKIPSGWDYIKAVGAQWALQGRTALEKGCNWGRQFEKCVRPAGPDCFKREYLQTLMKAEDAVIFAQQAAKIKWECTTGKKVLWNNYVCIVNAMCVHRQQTDACTTAFIRDIKKTPKRACQLMDRFIACFATPYGRDCGKTVGKWTCKDLYIVLHTTFPQCPMHCPRFDEDFDDDFGESMQPIDNEIEQEQTIADADEAHRFMSVIRDAVRQMMQRAGDEEQMYDNEVDEEFGDLLID